MLKIGSHVSMNGSEMFLGSVKEAVSYGANTFMVYTGAPQNTRRKAIDALKIEEAREAMKTHGIEPKDVVVHAPYILNLANPDPVKQQFAVEFLSEEIRRTYAMGAKQIVLHPGAHVKEGVDTGIENIIKGLNKVLEDTKDLDVQIALETMAGKGTEVGREFEEIKRIIDGVHDDARLSVCFDTCHTHDAGYDLSQFEDVLKRFDEVIGIDRIKVLHINDSKNTRGAGKDRHENLGFGHIGFETLHAIVHHKAFKDLPKILETPYITENDDDKKRVYPPYKEEIEMLKSGRFDEALIQKIREKNQK